MSFSAYITCPNNHASFNLQWILCLYYAIAVGTPCCEYQARLRMTPISPEEQALPLLCSRHFHQVLWLPETESHSKLRVTYATTTNFDDASIPVVLFIGPMFGTRWLALHFDKLARDCGVRVICVDRPGFGGSTPVPISVRMSVWLETVPALLQQLNVEYVAIVTHSAGTVYTLNTLYHHRSILDPKAPFVAFLAPWVSIVHSGARLPTIAAKLPVSLINSFAGLATFINTQIAPSVAWSGGVFSSTAALLSSVTSVESLGVEASTSTTPLEQYGIDDDTANLIKKLSLKYQFAENTAGANEEVKLCLRKCSNADWGEVLDKADYSCCIRKIAANEAGFAVHDSNTSKLTIEAFFAGSDVLVSKKGQRYFEQCWQSEDVKAKVKFTTSTLPETDHDSVLVDVKNGGLKKAFARVVEVSSTRG